MMLYLRRTLVLQIFMRQYSVLSLGNAVFI